MRYLFFFLIVISCQNSPHYSKSNKVDSVIKQNEKLNEEINKIRTEQSEKNENTEPIVSRKYAYVLITYMRKDFGRPSKPTITWSPIMELEYFDEDIKYRLMDKFESKFLSSGEGAMFVENITKRECFAFNSYADASKHLATKKSL